jgi:hypothetical protein
MDRFQFGEHVPCSFRLLEDTNFGQMQFEEQQSAYRAMEHTHREDAEEESRAMRSGPPSRRPRASPIIPERARSPRIVDSESFVEDTMDELGTITRDNAPPGFTYPSGSIAPSESIAPSQPIAPSESSYASESTDISGAITDRFAGTSLADPKSKYVPYNANRKRCSGRDNYDAESESGSEGSASTARGNGKGKAKEDNPLPRRRGDERRVRFK